MIQQIKPADATSISEAAAILKQGGLVAFPTETVYGLGADAGNLEAVKKIFRAKGRPADHPLIVHIGKPEQLKSWAVNIPKKAWLLAEKFWPGPLAMILEKHPDVPLVVTGGQQTVGLRMPDNQVALSLLRRFNGGIAAPSANRFNHISPTLAEHVQSELGESVDMILNGGACSVGLESTIIDLTGPQARLLRPGHISPKQIEEVLQAAVVVPQHIEIRAPGMLEIHYAPITPARLCSVEQLEIEIKHWQQQNKRIGVMSQQSDISADENTHVLKMPKTTDQYGQALYAALRELDSMQLDIILVEQLPNGDSWLAVNDRLRKATASHTVK